MIRKTRIAVLRLLGLVIGFASLPAAAAPNVVLIYADDLGYGDVGCYNADSKIETPCIDRLADRGVRFTDAHSPDTICSPSRYGIMTGRYSWRTDLQAGNPPIGSQPWIDNERIALPEFLRRAGYHTAVFGKWGLGSDWDAAARSTRQGREVDAEAIDYSKPIFSGRAFGFEHEEVHLWYGRGPFEKTYPCGTEPGAIEKTDGARWYFVNGISRGGEPDFADFDMEEAQVHYLEQTVNHLRKAEPPFFVYYAPHIPHWPHVPAPRFQGTTEMGYYGDFVFQLDWSVGRIVEALEETGQLDNTVIVFASDNGPERQSYDYHREGHASSGPWRGVKRDAWEGGHRTPFIVAWPGRVAGGRVSDRLVSQTDLFATVAHMLGRPIPNDSAEDSFSFLDVLLPEVKVDEPREHAIYHTGTSRTLAVRRGDWVYVDGPTGDNGRQEPDWIRGQRNAASHGQPVELFDLSSDPQQTTNLASDHREVTRDLKRLLDSTIDSGRTRK